MSTRQEFPGLPPSLQADHYDEKALPADGGRSPKHGVTPYLGLKARLSQIWINRWTILLLLVLVRVLILVASVDDNIVSAKGKALSACSKVEDVGSAFASMPHYLSAGVNDLTASGITKAVHALVETLQLILTGVKEIILFFINFLVGTYVCLIAAFIHGGLEMASKTIEGVTNLMNEAIKGITGELAQNAGNVNRAVTEVVGKLAGAADSVGDFFTGGRSDIKPPQIDVGPQIEKLTHIKIDTAGLTREIDALNAQIPTFDQVQKLTRDAVAIPFDLVKKAMDDSWGKYEFDGQVFPLAKKEKMTFCSDNNRIADFFNSLAEISRKARIAFIVVIIVLALVACVVMGWWEIRRWRRQQRSARVFTRHGFDPMDVVYIASRSTSSRAGIKLSSRFSGKRQILVRWFVAYATSLPAIFVLSLALAGFFSCLMQWILLKSIEKEVPALTSQVGAFAGDVVTKLQGVSDGWARDANGVIIGFNDHINRDILGYVSNATDSVNDTLTTFTTEMNKGLDLVFGKTPLDRPIKDVVRCLIGLKVEAVQKGLTWVHDHARIDFPRFPNDTFSKGAQKSISGDSELNTFLASPSTVTTDEVSDAVNHVVELLRNGIVQEALISTGLVLVYVVVVLIGLVRALLSMAAPGGYDPNSAVANRFTEAEDVASIDSAESSKMRGALEDGSGKDELKYTGDDRAPLSPRKTLSNR